MSKSRQAFWKGARAEFPLLVGVFPFGVIYGALALNAGLSPAASQLMSAVVFAGSAQFVSAQLFAEAAPGLMIALTVAVVNLRHMLYSASLAPYLKDLPMKWKVLLSYLLTDEAYAPSAIHYEKEGATPTSHYFVLGAGLTLWLVWQLSTAVGVFLGAQIPARLPLDFALPLTFIAMLIPTLKNRPTLAAALSAGLLALAARALPFKLGLILAALAGVAVGTFLESRQ